VGVWGNRGTLLTGATVCVAVTASVLAGTQAGSAGATDGAGGPRLLFSAADIDGIRAVAATGPGATWSTAVIARADAALRRPVAGTCERQARYALPDLAMTWLLTADITYARKARDVAVGMPAAARWSPTSTTPGCTTTWADYSWRWPQMMAMTALSYDWLRGSGVLSDSDLAAYRQDLVSGGQTIHQALTAPEYTGDDAYRNVTNYRLRNDAALGLVALALSGSDASEQAAAWSDYAWRDLFGDTGRGTPRYLAQMFGQDGVAKEGQGYYQDSFRLLIPYFVAVRNLTDHNPFDMSLVHAAFSAPVALAMPDGSAPTVDTGWRSPAVAGGLSHWVAAQYPAEPWHRWQWQREGRPAPAGDDALALALYRPGRSAPPPGSATRFLRHNAFAVLRSDWSPQSPWLLLNSERTPSRSPHEQADQTSFSFFARGAYLAIDPGDGRDCGTDGDRWLRSSAAHNLVLVDGSGPRVTWSYETTLDPADLDRTADVGDLSQARTSMTYADGVRSARAVLLAHGDYGVVFDSLRDPSHRPHRYSWRLHLADTASAPRLGTDRATTSTPAADGTAVRLTTTVVGRRPTSWSVRSGPTDYVQGGCPQHPVLQVDTRGARADLVSVLAPNGSGRQSIRAVRGHDAVGVVVRTADRRDVALTRGAARTIRLGRVSSDASLLFVSEDGRGPRSASIEHGRTLVVGGHRVVQSSAPVAAAIAWRQGGDALRAELTATRATEVTFLLPGGRAGAVSVDGHSRRSGSGSGGSVTVRVTAGRHTVVVASPGH
jgi:hypothetical protein